MGFETGNYMVCMNKMGSKTPVDGNFKLLVKVLMHIPIATNLSTRAEFRNCFLDQIPVD